MGQTARSHSSLMELRKLGLSIKLRELSARRIEGQLLCVDAGMRQGAYDSDSILDCKHLQAAYDAIAEEVIQANTPDHLLEMMIPTVVHHYALQQKWLPLMNVETLRYVLKGSILKWSGKRLLMGPRSKSKLPKPGSVDMREWRLKKFIQKNTSSITAVRSAAGVHKPDMQRWRHGRLSEESVISQRIEDVLRGKTPILSS